MKSKAGKHPMKRGFTLIEMLVVIAITGILAALLLPALAKAKARAQSIACLNNLKQLELCCHLYTTDNNDFLVPNNSVYMIGNASNSLRGVSWLLDLDARREINPSNIVSGLLFDYNRSLGIYHCPADNSPLEDEFGKPLPQLRWRSYNMSQSVNGYPEFDPAMNFYIPCWEKYSAIRSPTPDRLFTLIDEDPDSIEDAEFGIPPKGSPYFWQNVWWDLPADRHNRGANVSFADGHVERWQWRTRKIFYEFVQPVPTEEQPDYKRVQDAMRQPGDR